MNKILVAAILASLYTSLDAGCTPQKPALCGKNPVTSALICKKTYDECDPFEGCTDPSKPFLCADADCASNFSMCKDKFFNCDDME